MNLEYYKEYFRKYADCTEEDAVKVQRGAIEMDIMESIYDDITDKVAHQAAIVLSLNMYKDRKEDYIQEVCYAVCTADCEIDKVVERCREVIDSDDSSDLKDDILTLARLLMLCDKQSSEEPLGYICDELQRSYLVHDKPEYSQLKSNIDYILYDLLDILDLNTEKGKEYVYKHKEQFIRPIMNLVLSTGDIMLMEQMKQIYKNWMEWR